MLTGTNPRTGAYFVNYEMVAGAIGAQGHRDGLDAVLTLTFGIANLPVEALEHTYPVRIEAYARRTGSGGAGNFHVGDGIIRNYRIFGDDVTVSLSGERQDVAAPGIDGGKNGATGFFMPEPDGAAKKN